MNFLNYDNVCQINVTLNYINSYILNKFYYKLLNY